MRDYKMFAPLKLGTKDRLCWKLTLRCAASKTHRCGKNHTSFLGLFLTHTLQTYWHPLSHSISFTLSNAHKQVPFIQMQRGCSLFLRRAVQPGPGWWSAVTSPDTDCKAQCRCDQLPPPRGVPRPWDSAQTGRDHERSRSPRPLYREW